MQPCSFLIKRVENNPNIQINSNLEALNPKQIQMSKTKGKIQNLVF